MPSAIFGEMGSQPLSLQEAKAESEVV